MSPRILYKDTGEGISDSHHHTYPYVQHSFFSNEATQRGQDCGGTISMSPHILSKDTGEGINDSHHHPYSYVQHCSFSENEE